MIQELNKQKKIFDESLIKKCIAYWKGIPYPSFKENLIPIVFASDNTYAPYLAVAMTSIIENASKSYNYEFIVLETRISKLSKDRIEQMLSKYNNLVVKFVNPSNIIRVLIFLQIRIIQKKHIIDYAVKVYFNITKKYYILM